MTISARDQLIQTTCDLLELQGYNATGLNQILKESATPKGSLYYYFPGGKEQLAAEALQHAGDLILGRIRANLAAVDDPAEAIQTFILKVAQSVEQSGYQAGGPITTVALEAASTNDRLRGICQTIYTGWQQAFAEKLEIVFSGDRAMRLARVIISALEGGILLCRTERSPEPLVHVALEIGLLLEMSMKTDDGG